MSIAELRPDNKKRLVQDSVEFLENLRSKNRLILDEDVSKYLGIGVSGVESLRMRIQALNGTCRLAVHNLYTQDSLDEKDLHQEIFDHFYRSLIQSVKRKNSAPLICFESKYTIDDVIQEIKRRYGKSFLDHILILPTFSDAGLPLFNSADFIEKRDPVGYYKLVKEKFDILGDILFSLGVKVLSVSGMRLYRGNYEGLGEIADGCLGQFCDQLTKRGFIIDVSTHIGGKKSELKSRHKVFDDLKKAGYKKGSGKY